MFKKAVDHPNNQGLHLAPLDEIRQEEAKVARRILLARQQAESVQQNAREQAELQKQEAREHGLRDGSEASKQKISEAQREAERIVEQARARAKVIEAQVQSQIEPAARWAASAVLGLESGEGLP